MQTIKTAVVVVLLMVILYGAFVAMNGPETELPPDLEDMIAMGPDFGLEPPSSGPMTASPTSSSNTSVAPTAPASDSPFAMWPGATNGSSAPAITSPSSTATVTKITDKTATTKPETASIAAPSPSLLLPPSGSTTEPAKLTSAPKAPEIPPMPDKPAADPWITTLQNTVGGPQTEANKTLATSAIPKSDSPVMTSLSDTKPATTSSAIKPTGSSEFSLTSQSYENAKKVALEQSEKGKLKDALQTLSVFYNSPELTSGQSSDLLDILDALAFEVIYSRRHLIEPPYVLAPNEKLQDVAKSLEVPLELLAKINGINDSQNVMPGTKLKVFKGPFRSEVDVSDRELTLFLGEMYAGRFPISTGKDPEPREGVFQVVDKQTDRNYYGPGGIQIDGKDPRNPYGGLWLDLGQQLSIHGTPANPAGDTNTLGCISLSPIDARDVFTMLSRGSQVTIKR